MPNGVVPKPECLYNGSRPPPGGSQHNRFMKFFSTVIEEKYTFSKFGV